MDEQPGEAKCRFLPDSRSWSGLVWPVPGISRSFLIDYDPCSNYGNWMYLGGVGNDPRPNRAFNLTKQAEFYDPERSFRKLWLG